MALKPNLKIKKTQRADQLKRQQELRDDVKKEKKKGIHALIEEPLYWAIRDYLYERRMTFPDWLEGQIIKTTKY